MTLRAVVVGAGVSGLAAARRLVSRARQAGRDLDLTVLEAGEAPGGTVRTRREKGFLLEEGPDAFLSKPPDLLDLACALGLENELMGTAQAPARSFVFRGGRLHPVPEGFQLLAPSRLLPFLGTSLVPLSGKLRALLEPLVPRRPVPGETVGAFVRRRLGAAVLDGVTRPLVHGVYNADPDELELESALPRFARLEAEGKSLLGALAAGAGSRSSGARYSLFSTFRDGMGRLVEALVQSLPPGALWLSTPVRAVRRAGGAFEVQTDGRTFAADLVLSAVPLPTAARWLKSLDPNLALTLSRVPFRRAAVLNLGFERAAVEHPLDGFGFVVHPGEDLALAGCTFSSVKFPGRAPEGGVLLRAFLSAEALEKVSPGAALQRAREELRRILGIQGKPLVELGRAFGEVQPVYGTGHGRRVREIEEACRRHAGLGLLGAGFSGVGLPACVARAHAVVDELLASKGGV